MKIRKNEVYYCPLSTVESHGVKNVSPWRITILGGEKVVKVRALLSGDFEAVDVYFAMNKFPVHTSLLTHAKQVLFSFKIAFEMKVPTMDIIEGFTMVTASESNSAIRKAKERFSETLKHSTESSFEIIEYNRIKND